jgi:hypothetical protein
LWKSAVELANACSSLSLVIPTVRLSALGFMGADGRAAEIRTPLNILCGMADELQSYSDTKAAVSTDLALLRSAAFWLLAHANNTLDVCSLELGTVRVERVPFSPSRCVRLLTVSPPLFHELTLYWGAALCSSSRLALRSRQRPAVSEW